ncbi:MAG: sulfotransferase family protein [Desulfomonilaceae bacterium]
MDEKSECVNFFMEIKFSQSIGLYPEQGATFWLSGHASTLITMSGPKQKSTQAVLALKFTAGPAELYRYFPFLVHIYVNGRCREILEFTDAFESHQVILGLGVGKILLAVHSEQSCIPTRRGVAPDERELAVLMEWELRQPHAEDLPPLNLSVPRAPRRGAADPRRATSAVLPRPIFIIGMYRSGTSILTWAIGRHPNVFPLEETGWLGPAAYGMLAGLDLASQAKRSFFDVYDANREDVMSRFGASIDRMLKEVADKHVRRTYLARLSGLDREFHSDFAVGRSLAFTYDRWVDGTPENTGYAYLLRKMFPFAQFIHIVRDPADVVSSITRFDRVGGAPMNIEEALDFWLRYTQWGAHMALACGSDVVKRVAYERLVHEPPKVMDEIFAFLGEPRFHQAVHIFQNRINSSRVTEDERQDIKQQLSSVARYTDAVAFYEKCLALASRDWIPPDPQSEAILQDQINDVETSLMGIFTGKPMTRND